ncbi:cation:proton antiporter [Amycolatopsis regifaucium]|uniref:Sodium:proton antiporter n=1 Tax=Amycolatopsis regifaucium TaxID=546365 RepID=A0A154M522_9PSEU|nr:cation:proton antiporter [Amycolatopsis regifaucium]KZB79715.1 sodium:proton antiporter [Amycolatopsis regifaucium]OKA09970.1 sodium:proton antiporter [Amycolatopsis regifaucium]SFI66812.1 Kef-type K+ transport system, membrane component KefB [Amycolatopsis regifaucium]
MPDLTLLLAALAVLLSLARCFGWVFTKLGQPAVLGEIVCGLAVGVALRSGPGLPGGVDTTLDALAQLGLALFLFGVGARLAPSMTATRIKTAFVPALGATVVPLVLGALLALLLADGHAPAGVTPFVLFTAPALAVTAFPVLARILAERRMPDDSLGRCALTAAALSDVTAWTALAFVTASVHSGARVWPLLVAVPFVLSLLLLSRPWFGQATTRLSGPTAAVAMVAVACAGAAVTDAIGLHAAIGAFLVGAAVGRSQSRHDPTALIAPAASLLVPLYFVLIGRKVDLGDLDGTLATEILAVIAVAVVAKGGGAYLGARLAGQPPRPAAVFATLMNTRGVTELVFLGIGLGLGVIDSAFYTAMVIMALVTTAMTGPILNQLERDKVTRDA